MNTRFYAVAEDWTGNEGPKAEAILDRMLLEAGPETINALLEEIDKPDQPVHDDLVRLALIDAFAYWYMKPRSGHSLRIAHG